MKARMKIVYIITSLIFLFYLIIPNPDFPIPPNYSLQSSEPADTETPLRRSYFTNFTREEVLSHYQDQFNQSDFKNVFFPTYRLNYPPEEAQLIIREQTRSTFLEEIVHPFRESIYVNGFKPEAEKDAIFIENKNWLQKITVRYVPSNVFLRLILISAALVLGWIVFEEWNDAIKVLLGRKKR